MSRDQFNTDAEYKQQLIKDLLTICEELGWNVAIPQVEEDDEVPGLIIGTAEYVEMVTEALDEGGSSVGTA
jgi:hypothetical protein